MVKRKLSEFEWATAVFVLIGAINWGLIGAFGFNLILVVFNTNPVLERSIEIIIGLSGAFWAYKLLASNMVS
ncbi:MAG: DUF378 domain-containing protein [Patescibacteria group bacterium]